MNDDQLQQSGLLSKDKLCHKSGKCHPPMDHNDDIQDHHNYDDDWSALSCWKTLLIIMTMIIIVIIIKIINPNDNQERQRTLVGRLF